MNRRQIAAGGLSGKQMREFSIKKIALNLMELMKSHVGNRNAITKNNLFKKLYKVNYDDNRADHWMIWEFTKRAMHKLRRDSNCFVASARFEGTFEYFVVADMYDADYYITQLDSCIRKMRSMQKRVKRSVIEKWHKSTWELGYTPKKKVK